MSVPWAFIVPLALGLLCLLTLSKVHATAFPPGKVSPFEVIYPLEMPEPVFVKWDVCGDQIEIRRHAGENVFLPDDDLLKPCPKRVEAAKELLSSIKTQQFPKECDPVDVIHYEEDVAGMGSTMLTFALNLLDAMAKKKRFAYWGPAWYAAGEACKGKSFQCWFRSWGKCVPAKGVSTQIKTCWDDDSRPALNKKVCHEP